MFEFVQVVGCSIDKLIYPFGAKELPVPSARYVPSEEFVEGTVASLSDGNVSLGLGKITTQDDHDNIFFSLKSYFSKMA